CSISAAVGFFAPAGGISPARRVSPTFSQAARFLRTAASSLSRSSAIPPLGLGGEWQRRQYLPMRGATSRAYFGRSLGGAGAKEEGTTQTPRHREEKRQRAKRERGRRPASLFSLSISSCLLCVWVSGWFISVFRQSRITLTRRVISSAGIRSPWPEPGQT